MNPEPGDAYAGHQMIELERLGACAVETTRVWITEAGERVRAARRVGADAQEKKPRGEAEL